jgi:hypothetical protein
MTVIKSEFEPPSLLFSLTFSGMGGLFLSIGLAMMYGVFKAQMQLRELCAQGRQAQGFVFDRWKDKDSDGAPTYFVAFAFRTNFQIITCAEQNKILYDKYEIGDSLIVRYLPDNPQICQTRIERLFTSQNNGVYTMDPTVILFLIGFLFVFGWIVYMSIQSSRKEKETKRQVTQSLGFSSFEAGGSLAEKISSLYQRPWSKNNYQLRHVSRRLIPNGEMFLFDLVDTSGDDDSWTERQAVAIFSPSLKLPPFAFFPKSNQKYALSGLANRIVEWGMSKIGEPVAFPQYPALGERYVITSQDPDGLRLFMDESLARFFSQTEMYMLHAAGDIFTFAEMDPNFKTGDIQSMTRRVNRAMEIFRALQK